MTPSAVVCRTGACARVRPPLASGAAWRGARVPRASLGKDMDSFPEPNADEVRSVSQSKTCWASSIFLPTPTPLQRKKRLEIARYKRLVVHLLHRIDTLENDLKAPSFSDDNDVSTDF